MMRFLCYQKNLFTIQPKKLFFGLVCVFSQNSKVSSARFWNSFDLFSWDMGFFFSCKSDTVWSSAHSRQKNLSGAKNRDLCCGASNPITLKGFTAFFDSKGVSQRVEWRIEIKLGCKRKFSMVSFISLKKGPCISNSCTDSYHWVCIQKKTHLSLWDYFVRSITT